MNFQKIENKNIKSYDELKDENKRMKKEIDKLNKIIEQFKKQDKSFNNDNYQIKNSQIHIIQSNNIECSLISNSNNENEEDKIEGKINKLKKIIHNTKEKWKKIFSDIIAFEAEIRDIKNQMKINFENIKKEYQEELKSTLDRQYELRIGQEFKKLNDYFCKKVEEKIKSMEEIYIKKIEKLSNVNKIPEMGNNIDNKNEINENFSYKCINRRELYTIINKGDNKAKIKITLKNNGRLTWPEKRTILCFDRFKNKYIGDQIELSPQKPGEERTYDIILESLQHADPGEYTIILEIYIDDDTIGEQIEAKIIIKEKIY